MKTNGKSGWNYLVSELGDKINALLCGAGHNIRISLKKLREMSLLQNELLALLRASLIF